MGVVRVWVGVVQVWCNNWSRFFVWPRNCALAYFRTSSVSTSLRCL